MKKSVIFLSIMLLGYNLYAQNSLNIVLAEVEKNNTGLLAHRKIVDAEKIGNKIGLAPQNPEFEFNYLWGNPAAIGDRRDFSIRQSFDFPTAYIYKRRISNSKNDQVELVYRKKRSEVLLQAQVICVKLTYFNALKIELNNRYANAQKIAEAYKAKFSNGDISILEYNKSQVNLLNVSKELENNKLERDALILELASLNGGRTMEFTDSIFELKNFPDDFDQWHASIEANNPHLQWAKQEIAIAKNQANLNSAMAWPKLYAGYLRESGGGEQFQGVSLGITIPLWENQNTVKYARSKTVAMQSAENHAKTRFYADLKTAHTRVNILRKNVEDYRQKLAQYNSSELLGKAFHKGELTLTEYMYERSIYFESIVQMLQMEMDLGLAYAELNAASW